VADPRLADHTTLRVGGPAGGWLVADEPEQLVEATLTQPRLLVLGGGSNMVVADAGVAETVLQVATRGRSVRTGEDHVGVVLAAGEPWDAFVAEAVEQGWAGIEALAGIPGLAGATPIQNVGAYGQEVADVITRVRVRDRALGRTTELTREDCAFGYRTSRLKREPDRWLVLEVELALPIRSTGQVRYADLATLLGVQVGDDVPLAAIRDGVLHLRRRRGMVLDDADPDTWSAGSFFTNPVLGADPPLPADCPRYPAVDGVKVSAAWLIEQAGLRRGFALPDRPQAALSGKHTLAITNRGGATAADVMALARHVQAEVRGVFGVDLAIEPVLVGSPG
jgi:UDP-N-acetylmuramate dehydrogenase